MRTTYCPKTHEQLSSVCIGTPYGHVPGHQYHDVEVLISRKGEKYRCHVVESWGSAQGYDEEHGRKEVIGRSADLEEAACQALSEALAVEIEQVYLRQAMSQAIDEALEAIDG